MIYILYDCNQKNPVQQAVEIPEGMTYDEARAKIEKVYRQDPDNYIDNLIAAGFPLCDWDSIDLDDIDLDEEDDEAEFEAESEFSDD